MKKRANELKAGDVIRIEYGMEDNMVVCTVTEVSEPTFLGKYHVVKADCGFEVKFCAEPEEYIEMVA